MWLSNRWNDLARQLCVSRDDLDIKFWHNSVFGSKWVTVKYIPTGGLVTCPAYKSNIKWAKEKLQKWVDEGKLK